MLIVRIFTSLGLLVFGGDDQDGNAFELVEIDLATHADSSRSIQSLRIFFQSSRHCNSFRQCGK